MGEAFEGAASCSALDHHNLDRMESEPMNASELLNPMNTLKRIKSVARTTEVRAERYGHIVARDVDSLLNEVMLLTRTLKHEGYVIDYIITHKSEQ